MEQDKVEAVRSWLPPTYTVGELRTFIGFVNYYSPVLQAVPAPLGGWQHH